MYKNGYSVDQIAKITTMTIDEVEAIINELEDPSDTDFAGMNFFSDN